MRKRAISFGTILGIILTVIVFVIVIIVFKNVFSAANYAGRWECKFAYAIASPMGLFSQTSAVVGQAGEWGLMAVIAGIGSIIVAKNRGAIYNLIKYEFTKRELISELGEKAAKLLKETYWDEFKAGIKAVVTNRKFLKYAGTGLGVSAGLMGLSYLSNSIAENMQRPILDNLCKPQVAGYIDTEDLNDNNVLNDCISEVKKNVYDNSKIEFIDKLGGDNKKVLCLLYHVSRLVINTYGETIGTNVRIGYGKLHYTLLVNYSMGKTIYLSDLLSVLDLMEAKQNLSFYTLMYGAGTVAHANGEGDLYKEYKNKVGGNVTIDSRGGLPKIIVSYIAYDPNSDKITSIGSNPNDEDIIFKDKGNYLINFIYDGQGSIIINSIVIIK